MASGSTRSTTSVIEASATSSGSLEAIFSSARRSPAATSSACLRSVMSMMLARIRLPLELGRRTKRTSLGNQLALGILVQPFEDRRLADAAPPRRSRAMMPNDGVPSACSGGLTCSGPTRSRSSRDHLEEIGGVLVAVHEAARFDVEHDHRLRARSRPARGSAPRCPSARPPPSTARRCRGCRRCRSAGSCPASR